jgi:hypothetical protein
MCEIHVANKRANKRAGAVEEYVGRPSPLGNPFVMRAESDRAEVIAMYREWLRAKLAKKDKRVCAEMNRLWKRAREHGELTLVCWCAPRACHGDVIREVLLEKLS